MKDSIIAKHMLAGETCIECKHVKASRMRMVDLEIRYHLKCQLRDSIPNEMVCEEWEERDERE